jgi:GNAT superfamily N-acetyltransferase
VLELRAVPTDQLPDWRPTLVARQAALRFEKQYVDPAPALEQAEAMVSRSLEGTRLFEAVDDDRSAGFLWWGRDGDAGGIFDVRLDEPARVGELLPPVFDLARGDGVPQVGLAGVPDDATRSAMVALPGFVARATNMRLLLDVPVDDPGPLALRPMSGEEFDEFHGRMAGDYAVELTSAGRSKEAADARSREQLAELIPSGLDSPGQTFFTAWVDDARVGHLWLNTDRPMAFVYDIAVREDQRRRGYGAAIMNAGARWCRDQGHFAVGLNVFAHNSGARALYDRLGYEVTVDYRTIAVPDAG